MHYLFWLFFTKSLEDRAESHYSIKQEIDIQGVRSDLNELGWLGSGQAPLNDGSFCYVSPRIMSLCHTANAELSEWAGKCCPVWGKQVLKVLRRKADVEEKFLGWELQAPGRRLYSRVTQTEPHSAQDLSETKPLPTLLCTKPFPRDFPLSSQILQSHLN